MRGAWRDATVDDLGRVVTGKTPPTVRQELFGEKYPFITPTDIDGPCHAVRTERFLSEEGRQFQKNLLLPTGTVCFVCIGATIGKMCLTARPSFSNQQINSVIVDESQHDPWFVYYLLRHETDGIRGIPGGAATPIVNKTAFSNFPVRVPLLDIERKIGEVLSAYDELIENNTRRIKILEQMAQGLYREWFVGPCRSGKLPNGWEMKKLGDIADIQWGDTSTTKASYVEEGFAAYSASGLDGKLDHYDFDRKGIVLSAIGAQCGKTWFARGKWPCIKNTIRFWPSNYHASAEFLYLATNESDFWPRRGAAQPFISQGDARQKELLCPDEETMHSFTNFTETALEQVAILTRKNANLRRTRNLLLPKLISGEVDVSELDIETGESVA